MLARAEVVAGYPAELARLSELLRSLGPDDVSRPTRCTDWTVGDVAAHVIGTVSAVAAFDLDGAFTPEWQERQVSSRRGRTGPELADELDEAIAGISALLSGFDDDSWSSPSPAGQGTIGDSATVLWHDAHVHADDIRAALGRPSVRNVDSIRASVHRIAAALEAQGWGPATLALDGIERVPVGGGGEQVTGDAFEFVLAATGRARGGPPGLNIYADVERPGLA